MNLDLVLITGILLAMTPISEIRGSIPLYYLYYGGNPTTMIIAVTISTIANACVPFIAYPMLDFIDKIAHHPKTPKFIAQLYLKVLRYGREKARRFSGSKRIYLALSLFVGIPLPGTGAWTGTLVAYVLGLDRRKSIVAIVAGVLVAAVLVSVTVYLGVSVLKKIFML